MHNLVNSSRSRFTWQKAFSRVVDVTYLLRENYTKTTTQIKLSEWHFFLNQNRSSYKPKCAGIACFYYCQLCLFSGTDLIMAACVLSFSCNEVASQ